MRPALAALAVAALLSSACGSRSSNPPSPPTDTAPLPQPTSHKGSGIFPQLSSGAARPGLDPLPGWSNLWVLERDLSFSDFGGQIAPAGQLWIGTPATPGAIDSLLLDEALDRTLSGDLAKAQRFADLTFTGPTGGVTPAAAISSDRAFAGATPPVAALGGSQVTVAVASGSTTTADGTRLQQVVDLATGVGSTATLSMSWKQSGFLTGPLLDGGPPASWRVTFRDDAGHELFVVDSSDAAAISSGGTVPLPDTLLGTRPTLSFELVAPPDSVVLVDDVSVTADGVEKISNGDFSGGLSGWTASAATTPPRVVGAPRLTGESGTPRSADGLRVTRSFYVEPGNAWARLVDLVENSTETSITTTAVYLFDLGAVQDAVISAVPGTGGKAWSAWDAEGLVADLAVIHGTGQPEFRSTTDLAGFDGSEQAYTLVPLTIPPGGARAVVHFVVLGTTLTGASATSIDLRPTEVEAVAKAIVDGWSTTPTYRAYLSAAERAAVVNF